MKLEYEKIISKALQTPAIACEMQKLIASTMAEKSANRKNTLASEIKRSNTTYVDKLPISTCGLESFKDKEPA